LEELAASTFRAIKKNKLLGELLHYVVKEWVRLCRAISGKECRMKQWEVGANLEMQEESKVTNGNKSDKFKSMRSRESPLNKVR
jgi:hypothetical protein